MENKLTVEVLGMNNATVRFVRGEANNEEDQPVSDHFVAHFVIEAALVAENILSPSELHLTLPVLGTDRRTPYDEIELSAATALAPALREMADQIEELVRNTGK